MANAQNTENHSEFSSNWKLSIPVLESAEAREVGSSTPEWMVSVDKMVNSTIKGFEDYCQLFGWSGRQIRVTKKETAGQLMSSSSVRHSDAIIVIPVGNYAPSLETMLQNGTSIASVKIVHLGRFGTTNAPFQQVEYKDCQVVAMEQQGVYLLVALRPTKRTNLVMEYDQSGQKKGQTASEYDYTTAE